MSAIAVVCVRLFPIIRRYSLGQEAISSAETIEESFFFSFFGSEDRLFVNGVERSKFKCQKLTHLAWHEARRECGETKKHPVFPHLSVVWEHGKIADSAWLIAGMKQIVFCQNGNGFSEIL